MTSVEQLVQELKKLGVLKIDDLHWTEQDDVNNAIKQAQAMVEDEAHKAYLYGHEVGFMKAMEQMNVLINEHDGLSPINI